jgi:hypothetical protein
MHASLDRSVRSPSVSSVGHVVPTCHDGHGYVQRRGRGRSPLRMERKHVSGHKHVFMLASIYDQKRVFGGES